MRELPFGSTGGGHEDFLRRTDLRVGSIGKRERSRIALKIHPIELDALEPFLVPLGEVRFIDHLSLGRRRVSDDGAHRSGRVDHRATSAFAAAATSTAASASTAAGSSPAHGVGLDDLGRSGRLKDEASAVGREAKSSVVEPRGRRRVGTVRAHSARRRRSIRRNEPHFARIVVRRFDARADGERHPLAVCGQLRIPDRLHSIVVLDRQRAAGRRLRGRRHGAGERQRESDDFAANDEGR